MEKEKRYDISKCIVLHKVKEPYGDLLNMSSSFPMIINGIRIRSSEGLYQSMRFPHRPDLQQKIIETASPLMAKRYISPFKGISRSDWDDLKIDFMRWCLRVKLALHYDEVGKLLDSTIDMDIVEKSRRDDFWGCKLEGNEYVGLNYMGRLLMELRNEWRNKKREEMMSVDPMNVNDFLLLGIPIGIVRV